MDIDFVIPWVDGDDQEWRKERDKHRDGGQGNHSFADSSDARYRDWGALRYWFRGVERFAPWVNRIYLVTCGHLPKWLNTNAPKLVHVRHADYVPKEFLPTFSSHPIELNLNRISGLSEHFVYFNDDMFLTRPVRRGLFFRDGLPVYPAIVHAVYPRGGGGIMPHVYVNNAMAINRHFDMRAAMSRNRGKWFSLRRNGAGAVLENLYNSLYPGFPGFKNPHLPVPVLRSTMDTVWKEEGGLLRETCAHRFRDMRDVSMYVFRYWQLASGQFEPARLGSLGRRMDIREEDMGEICDAISNQKYRMICLNDMGDVRDENLGRASGMINHAFESILPDKSAYEL